MTALSRYHNTDGEYAEDSNYVNVVADDFTPADAIAKPSVIRYVESTRTEYNAVALVYIDDATKISETMYTLHE